jgi:hypothetical protein
MKPKKKKPARVRKPKPCALRAFRGLDLISTITSDYEYPITLVNSKDISVKGAKKLHAWLTRAIKYLEQERK